MRPELEKIKYIEDYLLGNLNSQEKADFETKINQDVEFGHQVEMQKLLMRRVKTISIKQEIKAAHQRFLYGNSFLRKNKWYLGSGIIVIIVVFILSVVYLKDSKFIVEPFINPPIVEVNKPFEKHIVIAQQGDVIAYASGSKLLIPPGAFLDNEGNIIKGKVEIEYREFNDPLDFYIAGIPMDVTVNGQTYTMESAAMCEVNASFNGQPVQVNPENPITVFQSSYTSSTAFDRYFLDTVNRRWVKKGKDNPVNTNDFTLPVTESSIHDMLDEDDETFSIFQETDSEEPEQPVRPIKPRLANLERRSFILIIDVNEFPEMEGFENIIFEVDEDEKRYNPDDEYINWEDVHVEKGPKAGTYEITFIKNSTNQKAQYVVWPVFEGSDYNDAMKVYNKKLASFKNKRKARKQRERKERLLAKQANRRIDSINRTIVARSQVIMEQNRVIDSINKVRAAYNRLVKLQNLNKDLNYKRTEILYLQLLPSNQLDKLRRLKKDSLFPEAELINSTYDKHAEYIDLYTKHILMLNSPLISAEDKQKLQLKGRKEIMNAKEFIIDRFEIILNNRSVTKSRNNIYREFTIDGFGIWNIDVIQVPLAGDTRLKPEFYDVQANKNLSRVAFMDDTRNALIKIDLSNYNYITINKGHKSLIWEITNDMRIVYFNDFKNIPEVEAYKFELESFETDRVKLMDYRNLKQTLQELMN